MDPVIQRLLPKLAECRTPEGLGGLAVDGARQCFGAHVACAIFLDGAANIRSRVLFGLTDAEFDEWDRDWRAEDGVFPAALERARPVHSGQLYRDEDWLARPVYLHFGKRIRAERYMAAPLFGSRGTLVGMVTMLRRGEKRPFDAPATATASLFAGFLSATLVRVTESPSAPEVTVGGQLAPRELQIARLAAAGRNNLEIALELGLARETVKKTLRRVYEKLGVRGRAPMAARIAAIDREPR